jgi:hypothetical protein
MRICPRPDLENSSPGRRIVERGQYNRQRSDRPDRWRISDHRGIEYVAVLSPTRFVRRHVCDETQRYASRHAYVRVSSFECRVRNRGTDNFGCLPRGRESFLRLVKLHLSRCALMECPPFASTTKVSLHCDVPRNQGQPNFPSALVL